MAKHNEKQKANHFKKGEKRPAKAGRKKGSLNQRTKIKIALGLKDDEELANKILKMGEELYGEAKSNWGKKFKVFDTLVRVAFSKKGKEEPLQNTQPRVEKVYRSPSFKTDDETDNNINADGNS